MDKILASRAYNYNNIIIVLKISCALILETEYYYNEEIMDQ